MPLTGKGKKIMKSMVKQYGKKKGESVFYASSNKGTIEGVHEDRVDEMAPLLAMGARLVGRAAVAGAKKAATGLVKKKVAGAVKDKLASNEEEPQTENKRMSYLDKIMLSLEEGKPAAKVVNPDDDRDRVVTGGRTGQTTGTKRLMKGGTKKASASAADRVKMHTAGPKGKLPENIAYAFNRWAEHLAEAGRELGPIAKRYEGKRASDVKDPRVKADVSAENKRTSKKLGVKTNIDAGQAIQQRKARGAHKSGGPAAGTSTEPKDIAKADAAEDKKKMAGDR
jgi:hypothetical protein